MKHKISEDRRTLTISVGDSERQELRDMPAGDAQGCGAVIHTDSAMLDFFEPLIANSELDWIRPEDTGDLTDAPMLGICERHERASDDKVIERWAFMDYQVRSVLEVLRDEGEVHFVGGAL